MKEETCMTLAQTLMLRPERPKPCTCRPLRRSKIPAGYKLSETGTANLHIAEERKGGERKEGKGRRGRGGDKRSKERKCRWVIKKK